MVLLPDHSHFEELAALVAGGYLSAEELREFREHALVCEECRQTEADFVEIVRSGLPLTQSPIRKLYEKMNANPGEGARERFLQRAKSEGIRFSPKLDRPLPNRGKRASFVVAIAGASALAAALAVVALYPKVAHPSPELVPSTSQAQTNQLKQENLDLKAKLAAQQQPPESQQGDIKDLREQLQAAIKAVKIAEQKSDQLTAQMQKESASNAQLLADYQNREKLLADTKSELARMSKQRSDDQTSTVAQLIRINDLSEQLRLANTNLDLERQMLAQGKDVRDLMGARQLHVVDVRDTDSTGKAGKAFGRVFLTEGKSLIFYAFDLNDTKLADAKHTFQVWGQDEGKSASVRSLGFLYSDDKTQRRWALKVDSSRLVSEIDSVFVTVEPAGGGKKPSGQRMLYAYLGEANHP